MPKLSVIIPFCNEYPQVIFTMQSLFNELYDNGYFDWEIIVINNFCPEILKQKLRVAICPKCKEKYDVFRVEDKSGQKMKSYSEIHRQIKYVEYKDKLSHWQAKNAGVKVSTGDILFFCDAHCVIYPGALVKMAKYYLGHPDLINGSLHLPLLYILDRPRKKLIYKPVCDISKGLYHYSFTPYRDEEYPYTVVTMSTCGMMISREIYNCLGGWPTELGIYGGGENFVNYTLAVLGKNKSIFPGSPLIHYAEHRGYEYNGTDFIRNRLIATYMFGGEPLLKLYSQYTKGRPEVVEKMCQDILEKCKSHREGIAINQVYEISDWFKGFQSKLLK